MIDVIAKKKPFKGSVLIKGEVFGADPGNGISARTIIRVKCTFI